MTWSGWTTFLYVCTLPLKIIWITKFTGSDWASERVYILYGPTRTGKSRAAAQIASPERVYYKNQSQWWHNYQQEETVILDDFYGWLPWDEWLKICDRYPYRVEKKGSHEEFTSKTITLLPQKFTRLRSTNYLDSTPLLYLVIVHSL